jgi:hypothetical protein
MRPKRAVIWMLTIGVLATSLMCSLVPVPPQLAPTTDPLQMTVNAGLTEVARPSLTATTTSTPLPSATPTVTPTPPPPTATPIVPGGIAGSLGGFPSTPVPPLRIVFFNITDNTWKTMDVPQNTPAFLISNLPPGKYYVVTYLITPGKTDPTYGGGYTKAVICGMAAKCSDHSLAEIEVKANQVTRNINPVDWYAPKGTFPKNPSLK